MSSIKGEAGSPRRPRSGATSGAATPSTVSSPRLKGQSVSHPGQDDTGSPAIPDTIRRNRPAAMSLGIPEYASTESVYDTAAETPSSGDGDRTPTALNTKSMDQRSRVQDHDTARSPDIGPATKSKISRKPSRQAPHKGEKFSTDDDADEYESDVARRRASKSSSLGIASPRQLSTLRRRVPAQRPSLDPIDSRGEEERSASPRRRDNTSSFSLGEDDDREENPRLPGEGQASNAMPSASFIHERQDTAGDPGSEEPGSTPPDEDLSDEHDDEDEASDAESFTLKDKQNAINETHPFGIRIWKPALYKKNRSVEKSAEGDIHSSPGANVSKWLAVFNLIWVLCFGWWLATAAALGAFVCYVFAFAPQAAEYGQVFFGLSSYLFYPFGKFVKLEQDEAYADEDEGEGRSISEYEQWQQGDLEDGRLFFGPLTSRSLIGRRRSVISDETESLLGRPGRDANLHQARETRRARLFGRGQWTAGRVIFFLFFYFWIAPLLLIVSLICWFLVFWIPMAKATGLLLYHLRRHPLALSFHSDSTYSRDRSAAPSSILLCTYRAVGLKYWKYTIDGTNIFLINLIGAVLFVIFDYWVLGVMLGIESWLVHPGFVFALALFSIIPLAYFIGQAVASISAQSSMGLGAAINAFFSTVVEVFLYCVALNQGKGQLVEGSIVGSIFAGILFLPGLSMCFGAIKRKTQRFNVKSAGVTSTMLLFAVIAAFGPTLFYQIYGSHELSCHACSIPGSGSTGEPDENCRRCYFTQAPAIDDAFFQNAVRPFCWFAAVLLFLSYIIGLWFTLRTHAAVIWNAEIDEKKGSGLPSAGLPMAQGTINNGAHSVGRAGTSGFPGKDITTRGSTPGNTIRETQLYRRILSQSLKQEGQALRSPQDSRHGSLSASQHNQPHLVPPFGDEDRTGSSHDASDQQGRQIGNLTEEDSGKLARHVAEIAATAAAVAARDVSARVPRDRKTSSQQHVRTIQTHPTLEEHDPIELPSGHDAPNWGRTKSAVILLGATVLYAIIAEILVNTVDVVLASFDIDEKFLGITLFALVPNTTEFLNAISFAMNGNIALSMEIGSAYALQVCLLQIPALVFYSAIHVAYLQNPISPSPPLPTGDILNHTFNLIFPQWDMVTVILCVFLLSYVYGEGKSNYFKGSILVLTYLVIVVGFYLAGFQATDIETEAIKRFHTIGHSRSGPAW